MSKECRSEVLRAVLAARLFFVQSWVKLECGFGCVLLVHLFLFADGSAPAGASMLTGWKASIKVNRFRQIL